MYTEFFEGRDKCLIETISDVKMYKIMNNIWNNMMGRCYEPGHYQGNYKHYGARGIYVCEEWHDFNNFYNDMSPRPSDEMQLDRIDNDGPYSKENCKWSTPSENSRNRRSTKKYMTHEGELVQVELINRIGWTKEQWRWYVKDRGIEWIIENYKNGTLPDRVNIEIDRHDLEGYKCGEWEVIRFDNYVKKTGHMYLCRCSCGKEKLIARDNIRKGKTTMCRSCSTKRKWETDSPLRNSRCA